jgi:hypothetical protein
MINVDDLKKVTNKFFNELCRSDISIPEWSPKWEFKGEVPHNSEKGCYAHLKNDKVVYIGLGISNSNKGSGLGSRIRDYWNFDYSENGIRYYKSTVEGIDSIITLPFSKENFYLAAALEVYLLQHLDLPRNKIHSRNK